MQVYLSGAARVLGAGGEVFAKVSFQPVYL